MGVCRGSSVCRLFIDQAGCQADDPGLIKLPGQKKSISVFTGIPPDHRADSDSHQYTGGMFQDRRILRDSELRNLQVRYFLNVEQELRFAEVDPGLMSEVIPNSPSPPIFHVCDAVLEKLLLLFPIQPRLV